MKAFLSTLVALAWCLPALASFSARSRLGHFDGEAPVGTPVKLTGPTDKGDGGEAFLPKSVAEHRMRQLMGLVNRAATYPVGERRVAPELPLLPGSRLALDLAVVHLDPAATYDRVDIEWQAWATSGRLDGLSATFPTGDKLLATQASVMNKPELATDRLSGRVKVSLFPRKMEPGTYPVLLLAWAGDRTIAHVLLARVESPCAQHSVNLRCRQARVERTRNDVRLGAAFEYVRAVLARPDALRPGANPCPNQGEGLTPFACTELARISDDTVELLKEKGRLDSFFEDVDCCRPDPDLAGGQIPR